MADALTRSATIRYGDAYIGRVVSELLGRPGALVLTVGLLGICLMGMQADYIGVSATLDDASGRARAGLGGAAVRRSSWPTCGAARSTRRSARRSSSGR